MEESDFALLFLLSTGVGPKGYQNLIREYGSGESAWNKAESERFKRAGIGNGKFESFKNSQKSLNLSVYRKKMQLAKVKFIFYGDKYYPEILKKIDSPPIGIFIRGNEKLLVANEGKQSQIIGVVGARKITSYGKEVTEKLVSDLCSFGFVICSGMALGVDGIAHKTAIDAKGATIAVLGCGVDCPYPRENDRLYEEILDSGGLIISEYPLGMPASPGTFPSRNRIIAGISRSILVTEAAEDSGSLITADNAIKQGKIVFAVPGPINSRMSDGTARLLKQKAVLVTSASDILSELSIKILPRSGIPLRGKNLKLSKIEKIVFECLENEEKTIDEISRETKIKLAKLSSILSEMELAGYLKNSSGKFLIRSV